MGRKRMLYGAEALVTLAVMPLGLYPSLLTILAVISLPALALAVIGTVRPAYFEPQAASDPHAGRRKYMHACAVLCALSVVWAIIWMGHHHLTVSAV